MRHWLGLGFVAAALWLIRAGLAHRARVLAAPGASAAHAGPESPMTAFGEIVRPLVYVALGYMAIKTSFAYVMLDASRYLSLFDLGGFLFLLASYAVWLSLKTRHRMPEAASSPAEAAPSAKPEEAWREAA